MMLIDPWWLAEYQAQVISVRCSHHRVLNHAGDKEGGRSAGFAKDAVMMISAKLHK